jgi:hypothetical protein
MTSAARFMHRPWRTCLGETLAQVLPADRCRRPGHPANPFVDPRGLEAPRCRCRLKVLGTSQPPQVLMGQVGSLGCSRQPIATRAPSDHLRIAKGKARHWAGFFTRAMRSHVVDLGAG